MYAVIKGTLILAVGFGLGYGKALYDMPDIRDGVLIVIQLLKETNEELKAKEEQKDAEPDTPTEQQGESS